MIRSFLALERIDPGFDANGLLTFDVLEYSRAGRSPNNERR